MSHPLYWIALQAALGIPSRKTKMLLDFFGSPEGVFEATQRELDRCPTLTAREKTAILNKPFARAKQIWQDCEAAGIVPLTPDEVGYPDGLRYIPDMPCVLYCKGHFPRFSRVVAVGVVGSRKPSPYGEIVCSRLSSVLAVAGVVVVSGGAMGLDTVAHQAALDVGGTTVAVLGCGIGNSYLRQNKALREAICQKGALVSEYPPKTPATRYSFPARNRLIAALSHGTVVVEAGEKSGSLITAECALEQGKDVFAVPGGAMSPNFQGSNHLIAEGATAVFSGMDILSCYSHDYFERLDMNKARELYRKHLQESVQIEMAVQAGSREEQKPQKAPNPPADFAPKSGPNQKNTANEALKGLSETALLVYNILLNAKALPLDELLAQTGLGVSVLLQELTMLELDGLITKNQTGEYTVLSPEE